MPLFAIPGNHDAREPMRQAFAGGGYLPREGFLNYVIEDYPMRIIGLDTLVPGEGGGALCSDRLRWIDRVLATAPDRPVLVLMHHPPFVTGISRMDRLGLDGTAAFAEIIRHHPQVERIACGHLHRAIESRFAGTMAGTAPSTAHQIVLDLRTDARISFAFEPPGYQLHYWREDAGLVTHTAAIGDWGAILLLAFPAAETTDRAALVHRRGVVAGRGRVPVWRRSALSPRPARPPQRLETTVCRSAPTPRPIAGSFACVLAE
jgi:Icc protein